MVFVLAILLHPDVQTMAQKELDAVTGRERLPTFEDRSKLPFVDAICKEVIRWNPTLPLSELLPSNRQRRRYDFSQV
jgi:cytochrome P450